MCGPSVKLKLMFELWMSIVMSLYSLGRSVQRILIDRDEDLLVVDDDCVLTVLGGRRSRDHIVVGFTTTYAISAYHH